MAKINFLSPVLSHTAKFCIAVSWIFFFLKWESHNLVSVFFSIYLCSIDFRIRKKVKTTLKLFTFVNVPDGLDTWTIPEADPA